jgi:SAM-dependent methyltransferase
MRGSVDLDYELQTHRAEDRHWWYRGRRRVLDVALDGMHLSPDARVLDAGCGSGRNMVELRHYGQVTGIELSSTSVQAARERHVGEVFEGSVLDMPFADDSFDLAVSLDVVEHLEDDVAALRELRRVVAPGGRLLVTVPAYQWLWSRHDVINHHHRRYSRGTLVGAAEQAGWICQSTTHFNAFLLPLAIGMRAVEFFSRNGEGSSLDLWIPPTPLNRGLQQPLNLEAGLIGRGVRIPAGLSLLALFG